MATSTTKLRINKQTIKKTLDGNWVTIRTHLKPVCAWATALGIVQSIAAGPLALAKPKYPRFQGCEADIEKYCKDGHYGMVRMGSCLHDHEAEVSDSCKTQLEKIRNRFKDHSGPVKKACAKEIKELCTEPRAQHRPLRCLMKNEAKLSEACKAELPSSKLRSGN